MIRFIVRLIMGILFTALFIVLLPFIILKFLILGLLALGFFRLFMGSRRGKYSQFKATAVPIKRRFRDIEDAEVIYIK